MRLNQRSLCVYIHMCEKFTHIYEPVPKGAIDIYICLKNTLKVKDTGNNQITQHAQKVSVFRMLKMDTA